MAWIRAADGGGARPAARRVGGRSPWRFDDLHVGHNGTSEGGVAPEWGQRRKHPPGHIDLRVERFGRASYVRPGIPQRSLAVHGAASAARRDSGRAAQVRRRRCAGSHRKASGDHELHGTDAPAQARRRAGSKTTRCVIAASAVARRRAMPACIEGESGICAWPGVVGVLWRHRDRDQHGAAA